eukprot:TRINITY_DN12240_c3_g1_i1.p1 TRINITY_DN12240_c3_g1~~TRINITY_DN12240_c3_g1_i1.p1  ORF type:complete len:408 (+),score=48.72 TRINITY_DN12240_c3_g1_i1:2-1225(+)
MAQIRPALLVVPLLLGIGNFADCEEFGNCYGKDCERFLHQSEYDEEWARQLADKISAAQAQHQDCESHCYDNVIEQDLMPFEGGITTAQLNAIDPYGVRYQIINHKVYREERCNFPSRCKGIEHFLLAIAHELPDLELVVNVADPPYLSKRNSKPLGPLFSFSKPPGYYDIMYPAWTFWQGGPAVWPIYPTGLGRWDKMRDDLMEAAAAHPWEAKQDLAFFRGSRTSDERDPLVLLSRARPDLAEAAYVKNQAYKGPKDLLFGDEADKVKLEDHCRYRYLFNFRGVAASFRHKHLFLCKSLVFHAYNEGDEWLEFYYQALKPWVHYVPIDTSLNDAERLIEFFQRHEELAKAIADRGYDMIKHNLRFEDIFSYWRLLLTRYAELQKFTPERDSKLVSISNDQHRSEL